MRYGRDGCDGVVVAGGGRAVAFLNDAASIRHAVLPRVRPFRVRLLAVDVTTLVAKPARLSATACFAAYCPPCIYCVVQCDVS